MLLFYQTEISFLHFLLWQTLTTADDEILWGSSVLQKNNFFFFFSPTWLRIRKQKWWRHGRWGRCCVVASKTPLLVQMTSSFFYPVCHILCCLQCWSSFLADAEPKVGLKFHWNCILLCSRHGMTNLSLLKLLLCQSSALSAVFYLWW